MNTKAQYSALLLVMIFIISCGAPERRNNPPDKNRSKTHNGKAVITEITDSKNNAGGDNKGYVDIYFNFIPSDSSASKNYLCGTCPDNNIRLFYDNRESFHRNWVNKWDIKPGNEYPAVRREVFRDDNGSPVSHEVFLEPKK